MKCSLQAPSNRTEPLFHTQQLVRGWKHIHLQRSLFEQFFATLTFSLCSSGCVKIFVLTSRFPLFHWWVGISLFCQIGNFNIIISRAKLGLAQFSIFATETSRLVSRRTTADSRPIFKRKLFGDPEKLSHENSAFTLILKTVRSALAIRKPFLPESSSLIAYTAVSHWRLHIALT